MPATTTISFTKPIKQFLVGRPWGRPRLDYTTIEAAVNDPNLTKKEGVHEKIKMGQLIGGVFAGFGVLTGYLSKRSESTFFKSYFFLGSVIDFIIAGVTGLVGTFSKDEQAEEARTVLEKYVAKENAPGFDLDRVVLSKNNRDDIRTALSFAGERGVVINARGAIGCGKTMTGRAIANTLQNQLNVKAQYWDAKEQTIQENLADMGVRFEIMGIKIGGETIAERVERLIANAVAHYRKTGEYVVLGVDEAHNLLGKDKYSWRFNTANPHDRSEVSNALGKIIQDKVQKEQCKGVVVIFMSNATSADMSAHLGRRFDVDLIYERPDASLRKELLPIVVNEELKNNQLNGVQLDDIDYEQLAEIGTVNLFNDVFQNDEFKVPHDIRSCMKDLEKYNILNFDAITKAIIAAVRAYKESSAKSKGALIKLIIEKLEDKVTTAVNDRNKWQDELKLKAGKDY